MKLFLAKNEIDLLGKENVDIKYLNLLFPNYYPSSLKII